MAVPMTNVVVLLACVAPRGIAGAYSGKPIGDLANHAHGVGGTVAAANETTVVITNLNYDGQGPAAHFWASTEPSGLTLKGDMVDDEFGGKEILKAYKDARVVLKLPKKITDYGSFGIFCSKAESSFGDVTIPTGYVLPAEQSLGALTGTGSKATDVILKDSSNMLVKGFTHDAAPCPSAMFVTAPNAQPKADELTKLTYSPQNKDKLEKVDNADVTVQLPKDRHWNEFQWFSVYCIDTKTSIAGLTIDKAKAESVPLVPQPALHAPPAPPNGHTTAPPSPNTGMNFRPLPALTAVGLIAVAAAFTIRRRLDGIRRIKCS